jgi:iron(II)-dependent oxidoreductase
MLHRYPVTNAAYMLFLQNASWSPRDPERWLLHWRRAGGDGGKHINAPGSRPLGPAPGTEYQPVTHVSLSDARAYCAHWGKRLPHAWEVRLRLPCLYSLPWCVPAALYLGCRPC